MKNNPVPTIEQTYKSIKIILEKARSKAFKAVNSLMVQAYWHIGRVIVEGVRLLRRYGERRQNLA